MSPELAAKLAELKEQLAASDANFSAGAEESTQLREYIWKLQQLEKLDSLSPELRANRERLEKYLVAIDSKLNADLTESISLKSQIEELQEVEKRARAQTAEQMRSSSNQAKKWLRNSTTNGQAAPFTAKVANAGLSPMMDEKARSSIEDWLTLSSHPDDLNLPSILGGAGEPRRGSRTISIEGSPAEHGFDHILVQSQPKLERHFSTLSRGSSVEVSRHIAAGDAGRVSGLQKGASLTVRKYGKLGAASAVAPPRGRNAMISPSHSRNNDTAVSRINGIVPPRGKAAFNRPPRNDVAAYVASALHHSYPPRVNKAIFPPRHPARVKKAFTSPLHRTFGAQSTASQPYIVRTKTSTHTPSIARSRPACRRGEVQMDRIPTAATGSTTGAPSRSVGLGYRVLKKGYIPDPDRSPSPESERGNFHSLEENVGGPFSGEEQKLSRALEQVKPFGSEEWEDVTVPTEELGAVTLHANIRFNSPEYFSQGFRELGQEEDFLPASIPKVNASPPEPNFQVEALMEYNSSAEHIQPLDVNWDPPLPQPQESDLTGIFDLPAAQEKPAAPVSEQKAHAMDAIQEDIAEFHRLMRDIGEE